MTYTFKLSRRLAGVERFWGYATLLLFSLACTDNELLESSPSSDLPNRPGPVQVEVVPAQIFAEVGQPIQLEARAPSAGRKPVGVTVKWRASGGRISDDGVFSADSAGEYKVLGRGEDGIADTTIILVSHRVRNIVAVVVSPDTANLRPAEARRFEALGQRRDGSTVRIGIVWRAEGGTIDASGNYVASSAPGRYRVIAKRYATAQADTAAVVIAADSSSSSTPTPAGLKLTQD